MELEDLEKLKTNPTSSLLKMEVNQDYDVVEEAVQDIGDEEEVDDIDEELESFFIGADSSSHTPTMSIKKTESSKTISDTENDFIENDSIDYIKDNRKIVVDIPIKKTVEQINHGSILKGSVEEDKIGNLELEHELEVFRSKWKQEVGNKQTNSLTKESTKPIKSSYNIMDFVSHVENQYKMDLDNHYTPTPTDIEPLFSNNNMESSNISPSSSIPNKIRNVDKLNQKIAIDKNLNFKSNNNDSLTKSFSNLNIDNHSNKKEIASNKSLSISLNSQLIEKQKLESNFKIALQKYCKATHDERLGRLGLAVERYRDATKLDQDVHLRYTTLFRNHPNHPWVTGIKPNIKIANDIDLDIEYDFRLEDFNLDKIPEPYVYKKSTEAFSKNENDTTNNSGNSNKLVEVIKSNASGTFIIGSLEDYDRVSLYLKSCLPKELLTFKPTNKILTEINESKINNRKIKTYFHNLPSEIIQKIVNISILEDPSSINRLSIVSRQMYLHTTSSNLYHYLNNNLYFDYLKSEHNKLKDIKKAFYLNINDKGEDDRKLVKIIPPFIGTNIYCSKRIDKESDIERALKYSKNITKLYNDFIEDKEIDEDNDFNNKQFISKLIRPLSLPEHTWYETPRLRHDGVYISRIHYVRIGKEIDSFYQKVNLVNYFRYLRFLPDGRRCISWTTTVEPHLAVKMLLDYENQRQNGFMYGEYRIVKRPLTTNTITNEESPHQNGNLRLDVNGYEMDINEESIKGTIKIPKNFDGGIETSLRISMVPTDHSIGTNAIDWTISASQNVDVSNIQASEHRDIAIKQVLEDDGENENEPIAHIYFVLRDPLRENISFRGVLSLSSISTTDPIRIKKDIKIRGTSGRQNKLNWCSYWISKDNNPSHISPIPLNNMKSFYFSRVKSYPSSLDKFLIDESSTINDYLHPFKKQSNRYLSEYFLQVNGPIIDLDMSSVSLQDRVNAIRWGIKHRIIMFSTIKDVEDNQELYYNDYFNEDYNLESYQLNSSILSKIEINNNNSNSYKNSSKHNQKKKIKNKLIHGWNLTKLSNFNGITLYTIETNID